MRKVENNFKDRIGKQVLMAKRMDREIAFPRRSRKHSIVTNWVAWIFSVAFVRLISSAQSPSVHIERSGYRGLPGKLRRAWNDGGRKSADPVDCAGFGGTAARPRSEILKLDLNSLVCRNPAIVFTELDDTVVMMNADRGDYHELDPIGTRIWNLLETGRTVAEICDALLLEYEVTPADCRRDVLAFLARQVELGIVQCRTDDG